MADDITYPTADAFTEEAQSLKTYGVSDCKGYGVS